RSKAGVFTHLACPKPYAPMCCNVASSAMQNKILTRCANALLLINKQQHARKVFTIFMHAPFFYSPCCFFCCLFCFLIFSSSFHCSGVRISCRLAFVALLTARLAFWRSVPFKSRVACISV